MRLTEFLSREPCSIVAHRGGGGEHRENSLEAIESAIEAADVIEVDVRLSRDGIPVLSHDEDLYRVFGVKAQVRNLTAEELHKLGIPDLQEVLSLISGKCGLLIDMKEFKALEPVLELVKGRDWIAIISFDELLLQKIRNVAPEIPIGLAYAKPPGKIVEAKKIGAQIVLPGYWLASKKAVSFAHKLGLKVVAWTVNKVDLAKNLVERGVDAIATDFPSVLRKFLKKI